jgi:ATP-dependent Clp protease ATP-binding subunit ClpC
MFERFTDRARRAVVRAQEEARTLNHDRLGTEHLLRVLTELGADLDGARAQVTRILDEYRRQHGPQTG